MASSGFLPLLHLNRQVQKGGGRVILCNLSEQLREMFRVTRLLITPPAEVGLFEEQPDVNSAIAKLR
jgi:anti-anti-sigma factor